LIEAVGLLNNGVSFDVINNCLYKALGFRVVLSKPNIAGSTVEVLPINKVISVTDTGAVIIVAPNTLQDKDIKQPEDSFGILGKRTSPEKLDSLKAPQKHKGIASYFKQKSSSGIQVVKE
jgi:hypothetical protein